jgi:predicted flap endonuclease-1-like 5' DNA nuclease
MKTAPTKPSHYELLLKSYDKALATYERTKTDEKTAKHFHKNALKDTSKADLEILKLEYERIKFRRKSRKAALKIAAIRLKVWAKMHDEEVKIYQLSDTAIEEETPKAAKKNLKKEPKETKKKDKAVKETKAAKTVKEVRKPSKIVLVREVVEDVPVVVKPAVPEKPPRKQRRSSAEVQAEKAALKEALTGDNFSLIEGVGEKVTQTLHAGGITTFTQLAATDVETLKGILRAARNRVANPTTWTEQAKLILANKFEELQTLQNALKGGRRI